MQASPWRLHCLSSPATKSKQRGGSENADSSNANIATFALVEERQAVARLKEFPHAAIQSAQILRVDARKVREVGLFLEFAIPLEHVQVTDAFLRLDHHRHDCPRDVTFLFWVLIDDATETRRQIVGSVVVDLRGRK